MRTDRRLRRGGPRGKSNGNERGNAAQRRARKLWLIKTFPARQLFEFVDLVRQEGSIFHWRRRIESMPVEGKTRCYACGTELDFDTVTVDRIIPGNKGGTYARNNIRPCCATCNSATANAAK